MSGEQFGEDTYQRLNWLNQWRCEHEKNFLIEVDGGIDLINGKKCVQLGADILVAGALCIFGQQDDLQTVTEHFIREMNSVQIDNSCF